MPAVQCRLDGVRRPLDRGRGDPRRELYSLDPGTGATNWLSPVGDGLHYRSTSAADGVLWTVDSAANLDAFDAASGEPLVHRPLSGDAGAPITNATSSGIAIAEHDYCSSRPADVRASRRRGT